MNQGSIVFEKFCFLHRLPTQADCFPIQCLTFVFFPSKIPWIRDTEPYRAQECLLHGNVGVESLRVGMTMVIVGPK